MHFSAFDIANRDLAPTYKTGAIDDVLANRCSCCPCIDEGNELMEIQVNRGERIVVECPNPDWDKHSIILELPPHESHCS